MTSPKLSPRALESPVLVYITVHLFTLRVQVFTLRVQVFTLRVQVLPLAQIQPLLGGNQRLMQT